MSVYLADITAYVDATFTNALGYDSTSRSEFTTWLDTNITVLVDPDAIVSDYTEVVRQSLYNISPFYGNAVGPFRTLIETACYHVVDNIVLKTLQSSIVSSPFNTITGYINAVADNGLIFGNNNSGEVPTGDHTATGIYTISSSKIKDISDVQLTLGDDAAPTAMFFIRGQVGTGSCVIRCWKLSVDTNGAQTFALDDGGLLKLKFQLTSKT